MRYKWGIADIHEQCGRVAVITGANTGIGFATAVGLAQRGAHVVLAVRNPARGQDAGSRIRELVPGADITVQQLDLASLESVRAAANALNHEYPEIDLLINNAGVMLTPQSCTAEGVELQFGTNHLGHFALTGLLLKRMMDVEGSRVVTVSSLAHRVRANIDLNNLDSSRGYDPAVAYGVSKLSNLLFTYQLQHRLEAQGCATIALAAHPGSSRTELSRYSPTWIRLAFNLVGSLLSQSAEMGALPALRAATDPSARGGDYYGPGGVGELRGRPVLVSASSRAHNNLLQRQLWQVSEELTTIAYPI